MNKPMTKQEWFEYLDKTWDAAQKEARAEQQEPVGVVGTDIGGTHLMYGSQYVGKTPDKKTAIFFKDVPIGSPLYTSPLKREWQGLTDEEVHECWDSPLTPLGMKHARMIEAKLKEKNT